jgi:uncharacterized protein (TIGR03790 family)
MNKGECKVNQSKMREIAKANAWVVLQKTAHYVRLGIIGVIMINPTSAQSESYSDVLVVININSAISDSIGSYFAANRNIPSSNIARINVPTTEEIDSLQFEDLRAQLEQIILARNLQNQINYIVTTKGVPLKVLRSNSFTSSSVESELTLILGNYTSFIGGNGCIQSPYFGQNENFSHAKYGIYLVTRLDGYNFTDVKGIIDRAAIAPTSNISKSKVVLNEDPLWNSAAGFLNNNMNQASNDLQNQNIQTVLETSTSFLMYQTGVLGYASWGSNDHNPIVAVNHAIPSNSYLPGAIAETYVSTSGRSFSTPQVYGQSLIADLIKEGVTGAKGYVYEPYSSSMAHVETLFPMYVSGFTLAESYYSASPYLSWMDVIVGDPKCRLNTSRVLPTMLPVNLTSFTASSIAGAVQLTWATATETSNYGFEIERTSISPEQNDGTTAEWEKIGFVTGNGTSNVRRAYSFEDKVGAGSYGYRLKQIDRDGNSEFSNEVKTVVQLSPNEYRLSQNYPNPFNPTTTIGFALKTPGTATLKVFNVAGQEVKTLFSGSAESGRKYSFVFEAAGLTSGTYFYVLESGGQREVKKMLVLK